MTKPVTVIDEPSYCRGTAVRLLLAGLAVILAVVGIKRR